MNNPYAAPKADLQANDDNSAPKYAGFWVRFGATIIDSILMSLIIWPLLFLLDGPQILDPDYTGFSPMGLVIQVVLPIVGVILFWVYRSATPGKILLNLKIVDADTGGKPSTGKFVLRYIGYILSTVALLIGFIWVAFDKRKQSWHDKLSNTVVIRE